MDVISDFIDKKYHRNKYEMDAKDPYCNRYALYMKSIYFDVPVEIQTRFNDFTNNMMNDSYISKQKLCVAIGNYEDVFGIETNQQWKLFKHTAFTYDPYVWKDPFVSYQYQYTSNNFSEESKQKLETIEPANRINNRYLQENRYTLRIHRPIDASINVHALRTLTGNEMVFGRILTGGGNNIAMGYGMN